MSDLYHIPQDDGKTYRLKKFVEYQHEVPSIHYRFLGEWVKVHSLSPERAADMCWYMSVTYNEITCIILDQLIHNEGMSYEDIWRTYKQALDFGSARKYAKNNDWFVPLMQEWDRATAGDPVSHLRRLQKDTPEETYVSIQKWLRGLKFVGRFASDLFMESICYLQDYLGLSLKEPFKLDWKNCANLTSGIFNIFYEDEKANLYDRNHTLAESDKQYLTEKLRVIQAEIMKRYPEQDADITMFIGKICSFRNLFKNARYGGFHHDRELGVIHAYEDSMPQYYQIYNDCYKLRRRIFPERFLGELHGWTGIRKERKKMWLRTGKTGAEPDGH